MLLQLGLQLGKRMLQARMELTTTTTTTNAVAAADRVSTAVAWWAVVVASYRVLSRPRYRRKNVALHILSLATKLLCFR